MSTSIDATPSYNYVVDFAFSHQKSDLRPADQRWGLGSISINTDKAPETEEEKREIARFIGTEYGYEAVAVTKITPVDNFIEDTGEILEGIIVND